MGRLDRRLRGISRRLGDAVLDLQRTITTEVGTEVVIRTPVLTGFARGNWRPSLNAPAVVPVTSLDPTAVVAPARIATVAAIARLGDTIYITNNAPYIGLLNRGHSPQAGPGYVQRAVSTGVSRAIKSVRLRLGRR